MSLGSGPGGFEPGVATGGAGSGSGSPATVVKIQGAPGCGKTTTLFEHVDEEKADGTPLGDMVVSTFTTAAQEEAKPNLAEVFPDADEEEIDEQTRTFHSVACRSCSDAGIIEDVGEQVIEFDDDSDGEGDAETLLAAFCEWKGLTYDPTPSRPQDVEGVGEADEGERLRRVNSWLKSKCKAPEQFREAPTTLDMPRDRAVELLEAWDEFKRTATDMRRFEHDDYVDEAIRYELVPDASVLFIDEFQDLSPQNYQLYKIWRDSGALDRIYIAGDKNQSIYSFRGAVSRYFGGTPADQTEHRTVSYRCPAAVVAVARGILEACPGTDPNGFQAHNAGGTVTHEILLDADELGAAVGESLAEHEGTADSDAEVFLLTRTNRQVNGLACALREAGIPYSRLGESWGAWGSDLHGVHSALAAIRADRRVRGSDIKALFEALPPGVADQREKALFGGEAMTEQLDRDAVLRREDVREAFPEPVEDLAELVVGLNQYEREALLTALDRGTPATDPARVQIGTIHSAKGLEAPCVYLFDTYTSRLEKRYYEDEETAAEEHRLYYVGATRASESLHLVEDFGGPGRTSFPGLRGALRRFDPSEVVAHE